MRAVDGLGDSGYDAGEAGSEAAVRLSKVISLVLSRESVGERAVVITSEATVEKIGLVAMRSGLRGGGTRLVTLSLTFMMSASSGSLRNAGWILCDAEGIGERG